MVVDDGELRGIVAVGGAIAVVWAADVFAGHHVGGGDDHLSAL